MKLSFRGFIIAAVAVAVCVGVYIFDPVGGAFPYPRCWIKLLTGYDCPGCGSARALHALVHGHVAEAWAYNPAVFFVAALIVLVLMAESNRFPRLRRVLLSPAAAVTIIAAAAVWTVFRNL